jgi:hypothetical protein
VPPSTDIKDPLKRFKSDLSYYSSACLKIRTKQAKLSFLDFNYAQTIVHKKISDQFQREGRVRAIVLKARQEGVSTYVAARFFRRLTLTPGQYALVVADDLDRAKVIFGIYDRFWLNLPPEVRPQKRYSQKGTELHLDNPDDTDRIEHPGLDSRISVETAANTAAGRGATLQMVHATEMAFWEKPVDTWIALMQAVPDDGAEVIIESTANGIGGHFYEMWEEAEAGASSFVPIFLPWWIHEEYQLRVTPDEEEQIKATRDPWERMAMAKGFSWEGDQWHLTPGQIMWRRRAIADRMHGDERAFRQEYPSTAEEAFLVSGNAFFDEDKIKVLRQGTKEPVRANIQRIGNALRLQAAERGYLRVWEQPQTEGIYVISADTASGRQVRAATSSFTDPAGERGGTDFSCADVLRIDRNERHPTPSQAAQLHGRMAPEEFARLLDMLGYLYSSPATVNGRSGRQAALVGVERNHSSGETVLRELKERYRYPNLYYSRLFAKRYAKVTPVAGWVTNVETRQPMLDELAAAVRNMAIDIRCLDTLKEMVTFVRNPDGKPEAQEGSHDDRVISLAIALQIARIVDTAPARTPPPGPLVSASPTGYTDFGY